MLPLLIASVGLGQLRAAAPSQELDRHELRILAPRMLEMFAVVTRTVNGGSVDEIWNFSIKNVTIPLPPDMGFTISPQPYQQVLEADFSFFDTGGRYVLTVPGIGISLPSRTQNGQAALVSRTLAPEVLHQRSGQDKNIPFTQFLY